MDTRVEADRTAYWLTIAIIVTGIAMLVGWLAGFPW